MEGRHRAVKYDNEEVEDEKAVDNTEELKVLGTFILLDNPPPPPVYLLAAQSDISAGGEGCPHQCLP